MEKADVVTVFLRDPRSGEVLLLRRSDETGSYTGQWGAVSGYVEEYTDDTDEDARREIKEETEISDATLVRHGDPFVVEDDELGREWCVHPFLFYSPTRDVETNYETTQTEWCSPTEIRKRETVPDLWRSYASVAPSVETVAEDNEHGSAYVAARALEVLRDAAAKDEDTRETARRLVESRPSMAVVGNRVARAAGGDTVKEIETEAHAAIERANEADVRAAENAAGRIDEPRKVVTLSRSGTVARTLVELSPGETVVAESRPGGEGVAFAEELTEEHGVPTRLVPDSCVVRKVRDADAVVVGADAVLPDGTVVNKVGSFAAALTARHHGVPFFVVASADKTVPAGDEEAAYENEYAEVGGSPVAVFERVPSGFVELVTEDSSFSRKDVRERAEEHARLRTRLYDG